MIKNRYMNTELIQQAVQGIGIGLPITFVLLQRIPNKKDLGNFLTSFVALKEEEIKKIVKAIIDETDGGHSTIIDKIDSIKNDVLHLKNNSDETYKKIIHISNNTDLISTTISNNQIQL